METTFKATAERPARGNKWWNRQLDTYPERGARRGYLLLVVFITIVLYYELYVGGGVATMVMTELKVPFKVYVYVLAAGNLIGAFASLVAGLADRFGRANLVIYGQLIAALITLFWETHMTGVVGFTISFGLVSFVEGIVLVATPALVRDFSPQVGRATAMGFWTIGPVAGSLATSAFVTLTLPTYHTWQSQYYIAGIIGLITFVLALLFLRELAPGLRDQLMVSERDRLLVELKAKGLDIAQSLRHPWRQVLHLDVVASALGVALLLFFYYTMVGFGVIYVILVFGYSVGDANAVFNWAWGADAVGLVVTGWLSDRLRVRKPLMLVGALGLGVTTWMWLHILQTGDKPAFGELATIGCLLLAFQAVAYVSWMACYTEAVEARNPALTATGLALYGWVVRVAVTVCFGMLPSVITTMDPLLESGPVIAAYKQTLADKVAPSPQLLHALGEIKEAAAAAPGQWQTWYWICFGTVVFFLLTIFLMRGHWSPAAAKREQDEHDAAVARELAQLHASARQSA